MSMYHYRRGSIFWALTLIGVGFIFLWQNFNPSIHPWQIIAKFWPILIIFWGFSKLVDYLQAQAHPETVPPPLFSGGEVILLVLILIMGTIISRVVLRPWHQWAPTLGINWEDDDFANLFWSPYTYTQTISRTVPAQPRLLLVNRRGDIEIRGSDSATLEAVVKKTIRAENEDAAKKISDQLKIDFVEEAGRYVLQTNLDSLPNSGRNVRLDFTLRVPKSASAEITSERGDILIEGLRGDQALTARRGDIHVANIEGLVRLRKSRGLLEVRDVKGNVDVEGRGRDVEVAGVTGTVTFNGEFSGSVQFRNIGQTLRFNSSRTDLTVQKLSGRLNMEVGSLEASGIDGPFELSTRQKDITLEEFRHAVKIVDTNGDVRLRTMMPATHSIDVELRKGAIDLTLPASSNFQIEAKSRRGDVDCDFSGPNLQINKERDAPSITGSYGKGGPTIRLTTAFGTIRLAREGGRPAPSSAPGEKGEKTTRHFHKRWYANQPLKHVKTI